METVTKKDIRKKFLVLRDAIQPEDRRRKSSKIQETVIQHSLFAQSEYILCYVNYKSEAETIDLIRSSIELGKQVYCPLVTGKEMEFYRILSTDELKSGFHGILEPLRREEMRYIPAGKQDRTLMIMPGAVFDSARHRIGYGGGYYDRYLEKADGIHTLAAAFSVQIAEKIPFEEHDIRPQLIVTENGCFS